MLLRRVRFGFVSASSVVLAAGMLSSPVLAAAPPAGSTPAQQASVAGTALARADGPAAQGPSVAVGSELAPKGLVPKAKRTNGRAGCQLVPKGSCSGAKLRNRDLHGHDLHGIDFTGSDLRGARLAGVNLAGADLRGAKLMRASFEGANLRHAKFANKLGNARLIPVPPARTRPVAPAARAVASPAPRAAADRVAGSQARVSVVETRSTPVTRGSTCRLEPGASCRGAVLTGRKLRGLDLHRIDLRGAKLIGADLRGVNFLHARLEGAIGTRAKLAGADLRSARMASANFSRASFGPLKAKTGRAGKAPTDGSGPATGPQKRTTTDTTVTGCTQSAGIDNCTGANLTGASLKNAILTGANLTNAIMTNATMNGATVTQATMSGTILTGANLTSIESGQVTASPPPTLPTGTYAANSVTTTYSWLLVGGYLVGPQANLDYANLAGENLSNSYLYMTQLSGASLEGAILFGANLTSANLENANLATAVVTNANLNSANLNGATKSNTSTTDMNGIISGGVTGTIPAANLPAGWQLINGFFVGQQANVTAGESGSKTWVYEDKKGKAPYQEGKSKQTKQPANLSGSNFTNADLYGAVLNFSNMTKTNLTGATLTNALMNYVDLNGSTVTGASFNGVEDIGLAACKLVGNPAAEPVAGVTSLANGCFVLPGADLSNWDISGAALASADLSAVSSGGITGTPSSLPPNWQLVGGYLMGPCANLDSAVLSGQTFNNLNLDGASLRYANLSNSTFEGTTSLSTAVAPLCNSLVGTNQRSIDADLTSANLSGTTITGGSTFQSANLSGATFSSAFSSANILNANFTSANLTGADLTNVTTVAFPTFDNQTNQYGPAPTNVNWSNANLTNTNWTNAVSTPTWSGANLSGIYAASPPAPAFTIFTEGYGGFAGVGATSNTPLPTKVSWTCSSAAGGSLAVGTWTFPAGSQSQSSESLECGTQDSTDGVPHMTGWAMATYTGPPANTPVTTGYSPPGVVTWNNWLGNTSGCPNGYPKCLSLQWATPNNPTAYPIGSYYINCDGNSKHDGATTATVTSGLNQTAGTNNEALINTNGTDSTSWSCTIYATNAVRGGPTSSAITLDVG